MTNVENVIAALPKNWVKIAQTSENVSTRAIAAFLLAEGVVSDENVEARRIRFKKELNVKSTPYERAASVCSTLPPKQVRASFQGDEGYSIYTLYGSKQPVRRTVRVVSMDEREKLERDLMKAGFPVFIRASSIKNADLRVDCEVTFRKINFFDVQNLLSNLKKLGASNEQNQD